MATSTAKPRAYAEGTTATATKSQEQIEATIKRYGAKQFAVAKGEDMFAIAFVIGSGDENEHPTQVRFTVHLPPAEQFAEIKAGARPATKRTPAQLQAAIDNETNRLWRALALGIKAKLVLVDDGIETIEQAMYAHVVNPATGRTVYEETQQQVRASYRKIGPGRGTFTLSIEEKRR